MYFLLTLIILKNFYNDENYYDNQSFDFTNDKINDYNLKSLKLLITNFLKIKLICRRCQKKFSFNNKFHRYLRQRTCLSILLFLYFLRKFSRTIMLRKFKTFSKHD